MMLAQAILKEKVEISLDSQIFIGEGWSNLVKDFTKVSYVNKEFLVGADELENNGKCMNKMVLAL